MNFKTAFILFFTVLAPGLAAPAMAQEFNFKVYSVNNGMPHSQVHDITQTHDGFIWFATLGGGLTRFDGTNFTSYTKKDGLNNDLVEVVFQDSRKRLWVTTEGGGIFRFEQNKFVKAFPEDSLEDVTVLNIYERGNGELWFATYRSGILVFDGEHLQSLTIDDGLNTKPIWDFWETEQGAMLIATHYGLTVYDGENFKSYTRESGLSGEKVFKIEKDDSGRYWLATSNGITIWDGRSFEVIREINGRELNYVYDIVKASDGKMWIGTEYIGVFVYEGDSGNYQHISRENGLSSNRIYSFFVDNNGRMWVATDENGVNLFKGEAYRFLGKQSGLDSREVLSLHQSSDGTFWVGTYNGIYSFDGARFHRHDEFPEFRNSQEIWDIAELPGGNLLFLMPDNTIYEYDGETFSNFTEKRNLEPWYTFELFVDGNTLWIGTDEGLVRVGEQGFEKIMQKDGLVSNVVRHLHRGSDGYLWIATYNGLSRYDGREFRNIGLEEGLAHSEINYITEDEEGNLWLGTGGGVSLIEKDFFRGASEIKNFGREEGMKLLSTQFLWFDEQGNLWQGTNAGLHLLDVPNYRETGTMQITHFPLSSEGMGVETNHKAILPLDGNNAYVGTMNGMLELRASEMPVPETAPDVYIRDILSNSNEIDWSRFTGNPIYELGIPKFPQITFPHWNQSLTFSFSGVEFMQPQNLKYRYKLEGFEDTWMPVTESGSATYTNIGPGDYRFVVQAGNGNGLWSAQPASFAFSVDYPFWRSYWFYLLVTVTVFGIGYLYTRYRLHVLEKTKLQELVDRQTRYLQEALEEKEVLIKEIHHRVKNNLAVITGLLELQIDYSDDKGSVRILKESQRRVQSIAMIHEKLYQNERLSEIDFQKYIEDLLDIISYSLNYNGKNIKVLHNVDDIHLTIDQAIPCGLILNELVSNAFEHAFKGRENGKICVSFTSNGSSISFSVEDDGIGLPDDIECIKQDSLGITLVETLALQLHGELEMEKSAKGSAFTVTFKKELLP